MDTKDRISVALFVTAVLFLIVSLLAKAINAIWGM